jgi:hypothetical protein
LNGARRQVSSRTSLRAKPYLVSNAVLPVMILSRFPS